MTQQGSRGEEEVGRQEWVSTWGDLEVGKGKAEAAQI